MIGSVSGIFVFKCVDGLWEREAMDAILYQYRKALVLASELIRHRGHQAAKNTFSLLLTNWSIWITRHYSDGLLGMSLFSCGLFLFRLALVLAKSIFFGGGLSQKLVVGGQRSALESYLLPLTYCCAGAWALGLTRY